MRIEVFFIAFQANRWKTWLSSWKYICVPRGKMQELFFAPGTSWSHTASQSPRTWILRWSGFFCVTSDALWQSCAGVRSQIPYVSKFHGDCRDLPYNCRIATMLEVSHAYRRQRM